MTDFVLTPEQEAEAQKLAEVIGKKAQEEALHMARLLASKRDNELLGATEFEIRERVHKLGAYALQTALNERKKGGTKDAVSPAPIARKRRGSSSTAPKTL